MVAQQGGEILKHDPWRIGKFRQEYFQILDKNLL